MARKSSSCSLGPQRKIRSRSSRLSLSSLWTIAACSLTSERLPTESSREVNSLSSCQISRASVQLIPKLSTQKGAGLDDGQPRHVSGCSSWRAGRADFDALARRVQKGPTAV